MRFFRKATRATQKARARASEQVQGVAEQAVGLRSIFKSWNRDLSDPRYVRRRSRITVREFLTGEKQTRKQRQAALEASVRRELMVRQMRASTQIRRQAEPRPWTAAEKKVLRRLRKNATVRNQLPQAATEPLAASQVARNRLSHLPNHQVDQVLKMSNSERARYYR